MRRYRPVLLAAVVASLSTPALGVWVFEPSAALDQRFDDNYTIDPDTPDQVSATRVVGTLGLSREAPAASFSGLIRVDGLVTESNVRSNELSSNQVLFLRSDYSFARSNFGMGLNLKRDTPSRDISADLTDISSVASDTGASVTQDQNVGRLRGVFNADWAYNLTRRTALETGFTYTDVRHELPSAQDALRAQWLLTSQPGDAVPENLTIQDVGGPFTVLDELDDFREIAVNIGVRSKLSPISTVSFFAGFSDYVAETESNSDIEVPFDEKIPDGDVREILRNPKRDTVSKTTTLRAGYDRAFTPTLNIGFQVGIYSNKIDETDVLRESDATPYISAQERQDALDSRVRTNDGYLANITATKNTGITTYSAKFGVDVFPSDIGSQVESLEAVGDLFRELGPLLDFSFRVRAYEPDAFNANGDDKFARRFLSMEPKIIWRFTRAWTAAASYRYRRQKSQAATSSGESNALLFSIKYTPPSAIRDAANAK